MHARALPPRRTRRAGAGSRRRRGRAPSRTTGRAAPGTPRRRRTSARSPTRRRRSSRTRRPRGFGASRARARRRRAARRAPGSYCSGRRDRRDVREVLRRGAQHRRAADVDHLDGLLLAHAVAARRPARTDRGSRRRGRTAGSRAPRASRRRPRGRGGRGSRRGSAGCSVFTRPPSISGAAVTSSTRSTSRPSSSMKVGGAAARDELAAELREPARELVEPGLVVDRDQRAHSSLTTSGRSSCSTAWMRARSVSTVSPSCTATRSWTITGPVSTPSST